MQAAAEREAGIDKLQEPQHDILFKIPPNFNPEAVYTEVLEAKSLNWGRGVK
jgi:hypothetical protein